MVFLSHPEVVGTCFPVDYWFLHVHETNTCVTLCRGTVVFEARISLPQSGFGIHTVSVLNKLERVRLPSSVSRSRASPCQLYTRTLSIRECAWFPSIHSDVVRHIEF